MKILYIGNYLDGTGWSNACLANILALDSAGLEVVPRAIKINNFMGEIPPRIKELEGKSPKNPDIVIQHVLPHMSDYDGHITHNIIWYCTETSGFNHTVWPTKINKMDAAWVLNNQSKAASIEAGVTIPINVIPYSTDISKFRKSYKPISFRSEAPERFVFYTIGEINRRKNLRAFLQAFHTEFALHEPVDIVIKTTPVGISKDEILKFCADVKKNLFLRGEASYKQERVICEYWNEEGVLRLHSSGDCFVCTSSGEAWSIPTFDALGMGRSVIGPRSTGFVEYLNDDNSWLVDTHKEACFGSPGNSSRESWQTIDINGLRRAMREVYENSEMRKQKSRAGRKRAEDFSYEKVGKIMKEVLK
jgi:glycosyltransferase involved in cell wall biosynthesis